MIVYFHYFGSWTCFSCTWISTRIIVNVFHFWIKLWCIYFMIIILMDNISVAYFILNIHSRTYKHEKNLCFIYITVFILDMNQWMLFQLEYECRTTKLWQLFPNFRFERNMDMVRFEQATVFFANELTIENSLFVHNMKLTVIKESSQNIG